MEHLCDHKKGQVFGINKCGPVDPCPVDIVEIDQRYPFIAELFQETKIQIRQRDKYILKDRF